MSRRVSEDCLSDLALDRLAMGELDRESAERANGHLAGCAPCRDRNRSLEQERDRFAAAAPELSLPGMASSTAAATPTNAARPRRRPWLATGVGSGLALAASIAMILLLRRHDRLPPGPEPTQASTADTVASKGLDFELVAVVDRAGHQTRARSGDSVVPGDRVQLAYSVVEPGYLFVIGIDGTSRATIYFPEPTGSSEVQPGREVELPFSLVVDAVPGAEHFYGVLCRNARPSAEVARAVETMGPVATLPGCEVTSLRFEKRL